MSDGSAKVAPASSSSGAIASTAPTPEGRATASGTDVVLLGPPTADGAGVHVLRAREERVEIGELRALEEGRPIAGEVVALAPRKDNPRVCDVTESYAPSRPHKGPAMVATAAYREGWDEIFAKPTAAPVPDRDLN